MVGIALLAPLPSGDGPRRSHKRLREGLSDIARRVALKAAFEFRKDILLEVYAAGICHGVALSRPEDTTNDPS